MAWQPQRRVRSSSAPWCKPVWHEVDPYIGHARKPTTSRSARRAGPASSGLVLQSALVNGLVEFLVTRLQVGALLHLAEEPSELVAHLCTALVTPSKEAKGRARHLVHTPVLPRTHALLREGLQVIGELDRFCGVGHGARSGLENATARDPDGQGRGKDLELEIARLDSMDDLSAT